MAARLMLAVRLLVILGQEVLRLVGLTAVMVLSGPPIMVLVGAVAAGRVMANLAGTGANGVVEAALSLKLVR
jgi:hypothetical protein